jgi:DNA mismatch endonuclease (patch repair protein)
MRGNRAGKTKPELAIRPAVHRSGLRFFTNRRPIESLRRTADLVFPRSRLAVFVDGCFWHGCPAHRGVPKSYTDFWFAKIERNLKRDAETDRMLRSEGWTVLRIWEHVPVVIAVQEIQEALATSSESRRKVV